MALVYCLYIRVMSPYDWLNVLLVSVWMTLRRGLALVFMVSVRGMNYMLWSYVTPSVVAVLA